MLFNSHNAKYAFATKRGAQGQVHTILFCHAVVFNGICFDGLYSGTHEDDEKIAKIRDVTINHFSNTLQRKMATENLLSLIVELRSSRRSEVATKGKCLREVLV